jgi:23S rRNA (adenine2503-C2)-methyltransferase
MSTTILRSSQDESINIVRQIADAGSIESRYVRRTEDTVIIYLSSMTGCDRACRFCHLTQTGQTDMTPVDLEGYRRQAGDLFDILNAEGKLEGAKIVHFNFMARGDALSNLHFINNTKRIIKALADIADWYHLDPKFKISTIFPKIDYSEEFLKSWVSTTLDIHPEIEFYYSLYSLDPAFRKRWIPKSLDPEFVGSIFENTVKRVRLHHALIDGENTSAKDIAAIGQWLERYNIHCHFNIVRYNPFNEACGYEASEATMEEYRTRMDKLSRIVSTRIISKVGFDVNASCGMFVNE